MCDKYNGYTNYQTWVTELWMEENSSSYNYWLETAQQYDNSYDFTNYLRDYHDDNSPTIDSVNVYADLLGHALQMVNWDEVGQNIWNNAREGIEA